MEKHAKDCADITQKCFPYIQENYRNNKLWMSYVESLNSDSDPLYILKKAEAFLQSQKSIRGKALEDSIFTGICNLYSHPLSKSLLKDIRQRCNINGIEYDGIVVSVSGLEIISITTTPRERKKFTWPSESRSIRQIRPDARFIGIIAYIESYHEECNEDSRAWIRNLKNEFVDDVDDILYLADREQLSHYYADRVYRDLNAQSNC